MENSVRFNKSKCFIWLKDFLNFYSKIIIYRHKLCNSKCMNQTGNHLN